MNLNHCAILAHIRQYRADMFKFDFAAESVAEGKEDDDGIATNNSNDDDKPTSDANDVIAKLLDRSIQNANKCILLNASSKVLNNTTNAIDNEEFKPNLQFHAHKSIDLKSTNNMDNLRYVVPKHKLSDDTTDLISGVYEGGLKVWECSIDLCRFLTQIIDGNLIGEADLDAVHKAVNRSLEFGGSTMELGCGHGLPGCLILRENIRRSFNNNNNKKKQQQKDNSVVLFSDFNDFVIHDATIPNAQVNVCGLMSNGGVALDECLIAKALFERTIFAGGDWLGLSHNISTGNLPLSISDTDNRLDLILASETTYTPESCQDTAFLLLRHLKIDIGVGLVATKRFYFGVGGGTDLFIEACEKLCRTNQPPFSTLRLTVRTLQSFDTGNANIRDLLEVRCQRR